MKKTISLLTFHHSLNYGANVQTYATCRVLQELGFQVEVIDIRIREHYSLIQQLFGLLRWFHFYRFRKRFIPISRKRYKNYEELKRESPTSDYYIVGSDQTWNPNITRELSKAFALEFGDTSIRRIAFSSSSGQYEWASKNNEWYKILCGALKRFYAISVRENQLNEIVSRMGYSSKVTLDPSLLVTSYKPIIGNIEVNDELVSYKFIMSMEYKNLLTKLSIIYGLKVNLLGHLRFEKTFPYHYPVGVQKWIKTIACAKIVLTDSFHGVAMSIFHKVNFVVFVGEPSKIGRIKDLLSRLELESRLYIGNNFDEHRIRQIIDTPIDYVRVHTILQKLRVESCDFLKKALDSND